MLISKLMQYSYNLSLIHSSLRIFNKSLNIHRFSTTPIHPTIPTNQASINVSQSKQQSQQLSQQSHILHTNNNNTPINNNNNNNNNNNPYIKLTNNSQRHAILCYKFRCTTQIQQSIKVLQQNWQQVQQLGKALAFDFFNQFYIDQRAIYSYRYIDLCQILNKLTNLNLYELTMKLSILQKCKIHFSLRGQNQLFDNLAQTCADDIVKKMEELIKDKNLSIFDCFNVLIVFRIQWYERLLFFVLKEIDEKILQMDQSLYYNKLYQILFNQLSYINWKQLKKYPNIIKYFTTYFSIKTKSSTSNININININTNINLNLNMNYKNNLQFICDTYINMCQLKFHLVGQRKIPNCLKQCIEILTPLIQQISYKQLCAMINSSILLPARYHPQFRNALIQRFHRIQNCLQKCQRFFPFAGLALEDINKLFSDSKTVSFLWANILYYSTIQEQNSILRGVNIVNIKKFIDDNYNSLPNINNTNTTNTNTNTSTNSQATTSTLQKPSHKINLNDPQIAARYCCLINHFTRTKDLQYISKIKKILTFIFQSQGIQKTILQLSLSKFLDLFILFNQDKHILQQIKRIFQFVLYKKQKKISIYGAKYYQNCLQAIKQHHNNNNNNNNNNQNKNVQSAIIMLFKQLMKQSKNNQILTQRQIYILLQIINTKQFSTQLTQIKSKLLKKCNKQDIQTLSQYYILYPKKTQKGLQQLLLQYKYIYKYNKLQFNKFIIFLSSLPLNIMENNRGRLEHQIIKYLQEIIEKKQELNVGLKYINQLNRVMNKLYQFKSKSNGIVLEQFMSKLYIDNLMGIQNQVLQGQWILQGNGKIIIDFLFKFQYIIPYTKLTQPSNLAILQKVYNLLLKMINFNPKPYLQIKFIQFIQIYKQYITIPQGIQIQSVYNIEQILKNAKNLQELSIILFILLKLHCYKIEEFVIKSKNILEYTMSISNALNNQVFSIYQLKQQVKSMLYQIKLLRITENFECITNLKNTISPILLTSLQNTKLDYDFHIMSPFLSYLKITQQLYKSQSICISILTRKINPTIIQYFINQYPMSLYTDKLFNVLINKIENTLVLYDNNSLQLLYFMEKMFYNVPQEYWNIREKIWNITNNYLSNKIQYYEKQAGHNNSMNKNGNVKLEKFVDKQQYSFSNINKQTNFQYLFGRYPMYMFCCIKSNRTNHKIFKYFTKHILQNQKQFLMKIKQNQLLKSINQCILAFIKIQSQPNKKPFSSTPFSHKKGLNISPIIYNSKSLQQYLESKKIQYKINFNVNGVMVPYFINQTNQVIIIGNNINVVNIGGVGTFEKSKQKQKEQIQKQNEQGNNKIESQQNIKQQKRQNKQDIIKQVKFNGFLKFQVEMYKKLLSNKNIKIWDENGKRFIQV